MAVFDLGLQRLVARVVYDGAAAAGKTTNLHHLCGMFTSKRRSELIAPEELDGRTLFFDWVQISGGNANGFPLDCQVVTVPGQVVLEPRRKHLLRTADAVVYVSSCEPTALERTREAFELVRSELAQRPVRVPLILQANKQDADGALTPEELKRELGVEDDIAVIAATAVEGRGVLETFVVSVRAIARSISAAGDDDIKIQPAQSAADLYQRLAAEELPDDWAETLLLENQIDPQDLVWDLVDEDSAEIASWEREEQRAEQEIEALVSEHEKSRRARSEQRTLPASGYASADSSSPTLEISVEELQPELLGLAASEPPSGDDIVPLGALSNAPPLPSPDVLAGFIWPATTGRDTLRQLDLSGAMVRRDLATRDNRENGSGDEELIVCKAGDWCLKTSRSRRFEDLERARRALIQAARTKTTMGDLMLPNTVLVLQPDGQGAYWLWTVSPWATTLRSWMEGAARRGDDEELERALQTFGKAALGAMVRASRFGTCLDVHPSNFVVYEGQLHYVDDEIVMSRECPMLGDAIVRRIEEYESFPSAVDGYVSCLAEGFEETLSHDDMTAIGLRDSLEAALVQSQYANESRNRLLESLPVER